MRFFCFWLILIFQSLNTFTYAQVIAVKDETQSYKRRWVLIKPLNDTSITKDASGNIVNGTIYNSESKKDENVSGEKISGYFGYIDDRFYKKTGLFMVKFYGATSAHTLMSSEGKLLFPSNPNNHFTIDTIGKRIYNFIVDDKISNRLQDLRLQVYDFDLNLINTLASNEIGVSNIKFQNLTSPSFIFAKHSNGMLMYSKDLELIKRFSNTGNIKYNRKVRSFSNNFGILEYDTLGYAYDKLINHKGDVVFHEARTRLKRINKNEFDAYSFALKTNKIVKPNQDGYISSEKYTSPFSSYLPYIKSKDLYIASYKENNSENNLESSKALIRKTGSQEKILIPHIDEDYRKSRFRISESHGILNSRNEVSTAFTTLKSLEGQVFFIDKYGELILLKKEIFLISFRKVSTYNYQPFDSLFVYKIENEFYCFNPMSKENKLIGPFLSISEYNTDSEEINDPSYILYEADNAKVLKLKGAHWVLEDFSTKQIVKTNQDGQQGVWDVIINDWIIQPRYFMVNQYFGAFFCSKVAGGKFTLYSAKGDHLSDGIRGYVKWHENKNYATKEPLIIIYSSSKTCKTESGKIKSYISSTFYGLIDSKQVIADPNYEYIGALPGTNYITCYQTHCKENKSFIFSLSGTKVHHSTQHYIAYSKKDKEFKKKNFKANASENVNSSKDISNLINVKNEVIEKAEAPPTGVFGSVKIGTMTWMTRNLDVSTFQNGDPIQQVKNKEDAARATKNNKPAWCYLNFDPSNGQKYGKYYNWAAVSDKRKLAPQGWMIPGESTWENLIKYLEYPSTFIIHDGKKYVDQMHQEERVPNIGKAMKSKKGWSNWQSGGGNYNRTCSNCSNWNKEYRSKVACHNCKDTRTEWVSAGPVKYHSGNGTNTTGFNALPGGGFHQYTDKSIFEGVGEYGIWWSDFSYKNEKTYGMRGLKGIHIYTFKLIHRYDSPHSNIYSQDWDYDKQNEPITPYFNVRCFHY